jgi:sugar lactone lactonase YvrE
VDVELVLDARAELGESPVWDDRRQRLIFVDILRGYVHEFDPVSGRDRVFEVGQPVGSVGLADRGDWVLAARDGFFRLNPETGDVTLVAHVEQELAGNRMNDGAVDACGRFWAGTMASVGGRDRGTLYRLDPDGSVQRMLAPVSTSNGIDWSPDGRLMYYVDTPLNRIDAFTFDPPTGEISFRRTFANVPSAFGYPDGLVVDAEGFVWLALWQGGALHRYSPNGRLLGVVNLPVSLVTKCAFGGANLDELYITTARIGIDEDRQRDVVAGGVFRIRPGVSGRQANRYGTAAR